MESAEQQAMTEALNRLWSQFLPQMEERLALIDSANQSLAGDKLTNDDRGAANSAAHKLAGVLGTFGLTKGTVLAREVELMYSGEAETDPASLPRLQEIVIQLKAMIESRK